MRVTAEQSLPFPVAQVWDALLDPAVLVRTLPGCERLETVGEHAYAMTVAAGVAAIKGTYDGTCELSDLVPHESLVMHLQGAGAPGTIDATVRVTFTETEGVTTIGYDADAVVGGMVGGVGQRMLGSVARRTSAEFFGNVAAALGGGGVGADAGGSTAPPGAASGSSSGAVYTSPPRPSSSQDDFLRGIAVGAGLVLLGALAGSLLGRRRRR